MRCIKGFPHKKSLLLPAGLLCEKLLSGQVLFGMALEFYIKTQVTALLLSLGMVAVTQTQRVQLEELVIMASCLVKTLKELLK